MGRKWAYIGQWSLVLEIFLIRENMTIRGPLLTIHFHVSSILVEESLGPRSHRRGATSSCSSHSLVWSLVISVEKFLSNVNHRNRNPELEKLIGGAD